MSFHITHMVIDNRLTQWGWVMHTCNSKLAIIGSDNGLLPAQCQAIIWNGDGILLIGPLGTDFSEILIKIHTFPFRKLHLKMSSVKRRPCCTGINVIINNRVSEWNNIETWLHNLMHFCISRCCKLFDFIASIVTADVVLHTSRCW